MPGPGVKFTRETAREMSRLGNLKRWSPENRVKPTLEMPTENGATEANPLGIELSRVQWELVNKMKGNDDAKAVSSLAMALKNVREVFHLVTGQAKPGVIRETGRSSRQRSQAKPQPLPDDGPSQSSQ